MKKTGRIFRPVFLCDVVVHLQEQVAVFLFPACFLCDVAVHSQEQVAAFLFSSLFFFLPARFVCC